jgi:hypothetical protein
VPAEPLHDPGVALDCPRCLETLEVVESLRAALREEKPEEASGMRAGSRSLGVLLAAAAAVLAILSSAFFYSELRRAQRELEGVRQASNEVVRSRQAELERALGRERAAAAALRTAPLATSVFLLNLTRGTDSPADANRVALGSAPDRVTLVFDRLDRSGFSGYRATVSSADGRTVGQPVVADVKSGGMLAVSLPPELMPAGEYALTVEGIGPARAEILATYRFRVVTTK